MMIHQAHFPLGLYFRCRSHLRKEPGKNCAAGAPQVDLGGGIATGQTPFYSVVRLVLFSKSTCASQARQDCSVTPTTGPISPAPGIPTRRPRQPSGWPPLGFESAKRTECLYRQ